MNNINTKELWDKIYSKPIKFSKKTMYALYNLIPDKCSVLDIGCGNGKLLQMLAGKKSCDTYGIDISEIAIKRIIKSNLKGETLNAENLDGFNKGFDVVVLSHTLEHITNDENLIRNCRRITSRFLLVAVPQKGSRASDVPEHVRIYDAESLTRLLLKFFSKVEDYSLSPHLILKAYV